MKYKLICTDDCGYKTNICESESVESLINKARSHVNSSSFDEMKTALTSRGYYISGYGSCQYEIVEIK